MLELSLNVLDIAQNSVVAGATVVELTVTEETARNRLTLTIRDNGCGMTPEQLARVRDPFFTTRTTRKVGMGIPLFRVAAEAANGSLDIESEQGVGTTVTAVFELRHIDRMPLGDMVGTVTTLIRLNPQLDIVYRHTVDGEEFAFDTASLRPILGEVSLAESEVMEWITANLAEGVTALNSQA
jgi:anti-sigma regulatory factor (Ser/Thr protein kinase)